MFFFFFRFNRTPVIMASGRELCYVLLVGILSCYGMSFVILSKPTTWNCTYLRIGLGLCLSICYSAILTKTNRISRIFNQGTKSIKRPSYTSPKSQVVIAIGEYVLSKLMIDLRIKLDYELKKKKKSCARRSVIARANKQI